MDSLTSIAEFEHAVGADEAAADVQDIETELRLDLLVATMSEPAGPRKFRRPGRPPGRLVDESGEEAR
jgi:hypothetical protein